MKMMLSMPSTISIAVSVSRARSDSVVIRSVMCVQSGEEVVALVVDDDEGREVDDLDLPHCLHAELGILVHLDLLDAVLREARGRAADRAEVESAVLLAGLGH